MNALKLYKFIEENSIEWHWHEHENDVLIFIMSYHLYDWFQLMKGHSLLDEGGIECIMKDGYLCVWMRNICEYSDIEIEEVFEKSKES
jgi:hypothetical protein